MRRKLVPLPVMPVAQQKVIYVSLNYYPGCADLVPSQRTMRIIGWEFCPYAADSTAGGGFSIFFLILPLLPQIFLCKSADLPALPPLSYSPAPAESL